jgi:hypothetical protein
MDLLRNQRENLHKALLDAVQSERELERLMLHGMDVRLWNVVQRGTREDIVFELIRWVEAQGRLAEFIKVLRQNRPYHAELRTVLDDLENVQTPEPSHRGNSQRSFSRSIKIFGGMLVVAAVLAISVAWLWNRGNQQINSNANVPAPSPVTNQSPTSNVSPPPVSTASEGPSRAVSPPAKPPETKPNQVARHIGNARSLYKRGQYQPALRECDNALRLDPNNEEARFLKKQIYTTINILNNNR